MHPKSYISNDAPGADDKSASDDVEILQPTSNQVYCVGEECKLCRVRATVSRRAHFCDVPPEHTAAAAAATAV